MLLFFLCFFACDACALLRASVDAMTLLDATPVSRGDKGGASSPLVNGSRLPYSSLSSSGSELGASHAILEKLLDSRLCVHFL